MGQASPGCNVTLLRREVIRLLVLVSLAYVGITFPQTARGQSSGRVPSASSMSVSGKKAEPTLAWEKFCQRLPHECAIDLTEPETLTLTEETWGMIVEVNERVNSTIKAVTDWDRWGVEDRWDYPDDGAGDCEDIQILKRRLLTEFGLPRRAMRMTVVLDEIRAGHAVLMVRTDQGDFILDNRTNAVLPWSETPYEYHKREGAEGLAWVALSHERAPVVTAARGTTSLPD
jgi:predicted transglutaminase-like cysteine proteinase